VTVIYLPAGTFDRRAWLALIWTTLLVSGVFAGPMIWLVREWLDNPYYEHGILVPLVSLFFVWAALGSLRSSGAMTGESTPRFGLTGIPAAEALAGPLLIAGGLILRLIGVAGGSEFLSAVALLPVLAGLVLWWFGRAALRRLAFPIGYLAVAIPLPIMDDIGFYFQRLSTISTTYLVRLLGIPASYQGAEVSLPPAQFGASTFFVGIQCSGLYSTMTLLALALILVRLLDLGSGIRPLLLIVSVVPIAVITNDVRLGSLLAIAYWQSADVAMAYYHNLGDIVFWLLALVLFFVVGKVLEWTNSRAAS